MYMAVCIYMHMAICIYRIYVYGNMYISHICIWQYVFIVYMYMAICIYIYMAICIYIYDNIPEN